MSPDSSGTLGKVLAWISLLLAFGAVQGVIYLKSYWGRFGLNPFQYADVDTLALVGLTGIGVTLALVVLGALIGGYIGTMLARLTARAKFLTWTVSVALIVGVIALAIFVDFGVYLVAGMLVMWVITWLIFRSPEVPASIKNLPGLIYIVMALTYVPLGSYYFGQREASKVMATSTKVSVLPKSSTDGLRLAGRLGDSYVLYSIKDHSILVLPSAKVDSLTLTP
jgi:hypothetical protein